jgi:hypothetical protein
MEPCDLIVLVVGTFVDDVSLVPGDLQFLDILSCRYSFSMGLQ